MSNNVPIDFYSPMLQPLLFTNSTVSRAVSDVTVALLDSYIFPECDLDTSRSTIIDSYWLVIFSCHRFGQTLVINARCTPVFLFPLHACLLFAHALPSTSYI